MRIYKHTHQGERVIKIYKALGPGPFTVIECEEVLGQKRIGPIIGALREDRIIIHNDGSQMPMVRRNGRTRKPPLWRFSDEAAKRLEDIILQEES